MAKRGRKIIDETGNRYGRLTVVESGHSPSGQLIWQCKCDCGNQTSEQGFKLRSGARVSCGCLQKEGLTISKKCITAGRAQFIALAQARKLPPEERKQREKIWRKRADEKRIDKRRVEERTRDKKQNENLADRYVARLLYNKTGITRKLIPTDVIEMQRKIILINRFLKENEK